MALLDDAMALHEPHYVKATYLQRFGAAFIDSLILAVPNLVIQYIFGDTILVSVATIGLYIAYGAYLEGSKDQATIGKKLLSIKVVSDNGQYLDMATAAKRNAIKYLSWVLFILTLPYIFFINERRRTPYDEYLNLMVVRAEE